MTLSNGFACSFPQYGHGANSGITRSFRRVRGLAFISLVPRHDLYTIGPKIVPSLLARQPLREQDRPKGRVAAVEKLECDSLVNMQRVSPQMKSLGTPSPPAK